MKLLASEGAFLSPQVYIFSTEPQAAWFTEENRRKMKQVSAGLDNEMKLARKHGVKVVFGTDVFGRNYADQSKELELRLRWFTPVEILRQATSTAGELLQLTRWRNPYPEGPLGVIREGAYADVLLVDGNPLEDIGLLGDPAKNLRLIVKDGKIEKNTLE
jgi:imidazolonepropionase-like amidohydrolase